MLLLVSLGGVLPVAAQTPAGAVARADAHSESRVSAEMVKGKLNPASSKPGDEIAVRLNEDVKSNGEVLLKKGSTIKGVVRKVQRAERKGGAKGDAAAQSMMQLEWMAPGLSGAASQQLNVALQSVVYTNPLYSRRNPEAEELSLHDRHPHRERPVGSSAELARALEARCRRQELWALELAELRIRCLRALWLRQDRDSQRLPSLFRSVHRHHRLSRIISVYRGTSSSSWGTVRSRRRAGQPHRWICSRTCRTTPSSRRLAGTSK
jgi:hypothetical protein